jgi:hypothetical protein
MKRLASRVVVVALGASAFLTGSLANAGVLVFQPIHVLDSNELPVVDVQMRARSQASIAAGGYVKDGKRYNAAGQYLGPAGPAGSSAKQGKKQ